MLEADCEAALEEDLSVRPSPLCVSAISPHGADNINLGSKGGESVVGHIYVCEASGDDECNKNEFTNVLKIRISSLQRQVMEMETETEIAFPQESRRSIELTGASISPVRSATNHSGLMMMMVERNAENMVSNGVDSPAYRTFLQRSKDFSFSRIHGEPIYRSTEHIVVRTLSVSAPSVSSTDNGTYIELLLVTGTDSPTSYQGATFSDSLSFPVSDVRVLDSNLRCVAVLGSSNNSSSMTCVNVNVNCDSSRSQDSVGAVTVSEEEIVRNKEHSILALKRYFLVSAISSACLAPPLPHSPCGSRVVVLSTVHSTDPSSALLSNKLIFWHFKVKERDRRESEGSAADADRVGMSTAQCQSESESASLSSLMSSLLSSSSTLPYKCSSTAPPSSSSSSRRGAGGSRGSEMLLVMGGTGRQHNLVLGDYNGHLWGAPLVAESDFPGPMYPPGFTLMQRVRCYVEMEDELDNVPTAAAVHTVKREGKGEEEEEDSHLAVIDVGVCPYYSQSKACTADCPASTSILPFTRGHSRSEDLLFLLAHRLPLRIVGSARSSLLDVKARFLALKKLATARAKSSASSANLKRKMTPTWGPNRMNKNKKKKGTRSSSKGRGTGRAVPKDSASEVDGEEVEVDAEGDDEADMEGDGEGEGDHEWEADAMEVQRPVLGQGQERTTSSMEVLEEDKEDPESLDPSIPVAVPPPPPTLSLTDVLTVPRRVLTGDFALRLSKAEQVQTMCIDAAPHILPLLTSSLTKLLFLPLMLPLFYSPISLLFQDLRTLNSS